MNGTLSIKLADRQPDTYCVEWKGEDNAYWEGTFMESALEIAVCRLVACLSRRQGNPAEFGFVPF
jgi:hypothetical protein